MNEERTENQLRGFCSISANKRKIWRHLGRYMDGANEVEGRPDDKAGIKFSFQELGENDINDRARHLD